MNERRDKELPIKHEHAMDACPVSCKLPPAFRSKLKVPDDPQATAPPNDATSAADTFVPMKTESTTATLEPK